MNIILLEDSLYKAATPARPVCRLHYVTADVKDVVRADLETRYGHQVECDIAYNGRPFGNSIHLDYGGVAIGHWEPIKLEADGVVFSFWAHHDDILYRAVERALSDPRHGHCKVNSHYYIFCTTAARLSALKEALRDNDAEIQKQADREVEEWVATRKELIAEGVLKPKQ